MASCSMATLPLSLMGNSSYMAPEPCKCKVTPVYCKVGKSPQYFMLSDGVLYDQRGAGEIVANHQFQFDLPSQSSALFNKGWSVVSSNGKRLLALNAAARGSGTVRRALTGCVQVV